MNSIIADRPSTSVPASKSTSADLEPGDGVAHGHDRDVLLAFGVDLGVLALTRPWPRLGASPRSSAPRPSPSAVAARLAAGRLGRRRRLAPPSARRRLPRGTPRPLGGGLGALGRVVDPLDPLAADDERQHEAERDGGDADARGARSGSRLPKNRIEQERHRHDGGEEPDLVEQVRDDASHGARVSPSSGRRRRCRCSGGCGRASGRWPGRRHLGGGHGDDEQGEDLARWQRCRAMAPKAHQVDVDRVEDQLDRHEHHHAVLAGEHAVDADAEQDRRRGRGTG